MVSGSFTLPARLIDIHTHVWGREDRDGLAPREQDEQTLIEMADRYGIESMVVLPLFGGMYPRLDQIIAGNDAVAALGKRDSRMKPFVTVYPRHGQAAVDEARQRLAQEGFFGLKLWVTPANEPEVDALMELLVELDKPLLIHAMHKSVGQYPLESDPVDIARLGRRFPEARILMAHIGGNFIYSCGAIRDVPNVWTDPSGSYCETGMLEMAVRELGAHRILFGSDGPYVDLVNNIAKVMAADLSDDDKDAIMYRNAKRFLS